MAPTADLIAAASTTVTSDPTDQLDHLAAGWLLTLRTENTRAGYQQDVATLAAWLTERSVGLLDATEGHLAAWARHGTEVEHRTASTVARRLAAASSFYRYAKRAGRITTNPAAEVTRPRTGPGHAKPTPALDTGQARRLVEVAEAHGPRDHALVLALVTMGLRVSEALALDVEDLRTERGHHVATIRGKGGRRDTLPVPPPLVRAIEGATVGRATGPVFVDSDGNRWTRHHAGRALRRLGNRAGIGPVTPHMLRATAITEALEAGVSLRDVQDLARHTDPATTRRYDRNRTGLDRTAGASAAILARIT